MRFLTLTLVSTLTSLASSAGIPGLPSCAQSCIKYGDCGHFDVKCICQDKKLIAELSCCVSKSCSASEQKKVIKFADSICAGQGVKDLPTKAGCSALAAYTGSSSSSSANAAATYGLFDGAGIGLVAAGLAAAL